MQRHCPENHLGKGDLLAIIEQTDETPIQDRQPIVVGQEKIAGVRVAVEHGPSVAREDRSANQGLDHCLYETTAIAAFVEAGVRDFDSMDPLHRGDSGRAILQQCRNMNSRLGCIDRHGLGQIALFFVETHFVSELLLDLLKQFFIIQTRDLQFLAAFIQMRADFTQKLQFQRKTLFDTGLKNFENAVT